MEMKVDVMWMIKTVFSFWHHWRLFLEACFINANKLDDIFFLSKDELYYDIFFVLFLFVCRIWAVKSRQSDTSCHGGLRAVPDDVPAARRWQNHFVTAGARSHQLS